MRDEFGVELLERAGGGVAGVGKRFFTFGGELGVERVKIFDGNVSLAAHFEQVGQASRRPFLFGFRIFCDTDAGGTPVHYLIPTECRERF